MTTHLTCETNEGEAKSTILKEVADRLAEINIQAQLKAAVETRDFLASITRPVKKNKEDLAEMERGIAILTSDEFREKITGVFYSNYAKLDSADLARYLGDLRYEERVSDVAITLIPELTQLNVDTFGK